MAENIISMQNMSIFNKTSFFEMLTACLGVLSPSTMENYLKNSIKSGQIARVGRNTYCVKGNLKDYEYNYSDISEGVAKTLNENFYDLDFRIFELYQMNRFFNHQIAHNVIFVFAEKELTLSVFEKLKKNYEGNILINPTEKDFYNYRRDNIIIVKNLLTESPKGKKEIWHTDAEKLLVDIFSDNLLKSMFSESEYPNIYETAFNSYVIDESKMFRYAERRKTANKIRSLIENETQVKLHVSAHTH